MTAYANVYTFEYTIVMLIETLSVREAREQLSGVLERFRRGDRTPVGFGSHRRTEAVVVSVEVFEELTAERAQSARQAAASVRAEGLSPSSGADVILQQWEQGEISTAQMRENMRHLHGLS
ncbi:antitoxin VbhA family protein [Nocardia callitridis]|uniref:Antitoxin VbhA domain-containing protein n=1 Tax=Nocardia callitridis TaxID=648753 RepID=A0ABP9JWN7_9NOCA